MALRGKVWCLLVFYLRLLARYVIIYIENICIQYNMSQCVFTSTSCAVVSFVMG